MKEFYSIFLRIPFKWTPPLGYIFVWQMTAISLFCVIFVIIPLMSFGIGSCWLMILFIKDILNDLTKLSQITKKSNKIAWELKVRLCNVVQLYSEAKELSGAFLFNLFSSDSKSIMCILSGQIYQPIQRNYRIFNFDCIRIHAVEHFEFTFCSCFATCKTSFPFSSRQK